MQGFRGLGCRVLGVRILGSRDFRDSGFRTDGQNPGNYGSIMQDFVHQADQANINDTPTFLGVILNP